MKYIILTALMAVTIFACSNTGNKTSTGVDSSPQDSLITVIDLPQVDLSKTLASDTNIVMIDVRTPAEVSEGYIPEADMFIDYNGDSFENDIAQLDKSKTYVMYCRSGGRSGKASDYMVKSGFKVVYNLEGGVLGYKDVLVK